MKHKKFLLIALICLIGIGISFLLFSAHRPFKDLEAADITSASVRLSPPDTTIQIVETEELVSYLNEVVIYNKDNSYTEYAGQAVIFTLSLADGSQVEITAYRTYLILRRRLPPYILQSKTDWRDSYRKISRGGKTIGGHVLCQSPRCNQPSGWLP